MNNRSWHLALGVVAAGAIALAAQDGQAQIGYNNAVTFNGDFNYGNAQAGNEIILAGSSAGDEITSFSFQYDFLTSSLGASSTPTGGETATLSFYQNYGPGVRVFGSTVPQGPALYSSTFTLPFFTTGSTATFSIANGSFGANGVDVPQIFTWTVTFANIGAAETAGLALYSNPTVGQNYNDAWYSSTAGAAGPWGLLVTSTGTPPLTFGALVTTVPEPATLGMFTMGAAGLLASGWLNLRRR